MRSLMLDQPRTRLGCLGLAAVFLAASGLGVGCDGTASPGAATPVAGTPSRQASQHPDPLVSSCQRAPCPNGQEFEIFDKNGAPIFSVGEYGGASVFSDNIRVWAPGTSLLTGNAAVTFSWESPQQYDRQFKLTTGCTPPAIWLSPQAIWTCTPSHAWKIDMNF